MQLFLKMLEREHQCATVHDLSLSMRQSAEQDSMSAQLCLSFMNSQEIGMPFARVIQVGAHCVQLASSIIVASAFGGLIYEILLLRLELAIAITTFALSLVSHLVNDTSTVHQVGLQVLCRYW